MQVVRYLLLLIVIISKQGVAQLNNTSLEDPLNLHDSSSESIGLNLYSHNFFKNNEYFDDIASGYTLFGTQVKASVFYNVNPLLRLQAGVYARKDFGNPALQTIAPLFTIAYQQKGHTLLMGNLEGNVAHRLIEPLYNYERVILNHLENGLQWKIDRKHLWSDTWINWEVQQYLNSPYQEYLSAGHSSMTTVFNSRNGWKVTLPMQGIITHRGGQLDTDTTGMRTLLNAATGFEIQYTNNNAASWFRSFRTSNYIAVFRDASPTKAMSFEQGYGVYLNASLQTSYDVSASLGYWMGRNYLATHGGDLFQSAASVFGKPGYTEPKRDLVFVRLMYQKKIMDALFVDVRMEPFYDLNKKYLAYAYLVYLTYRTDLTFVNLMKGKRVKN